MSQIDHLVSYFFQAGNPGNPGDVSVEAIRAAVLEEVALGRTWASIALACGWKRRSKGRSGFVGRGETVQRRLGMLPSYCGRTPARLSKTMRYETAVKIVKAIDLDPVDFGL